MRLLSPYSDHNRTEFSAPHFGQIPPPCSAKPALERQSIHAIGIRIATKALMLSPIHFRYAISSTNAAAVAQKKPAARPSQTPGASEPPGAGWAHAALYRELHFRHFIRTSQIQAGFGSKRTCDYAFPVPHGGRQSARTAKGFPPLTDS